LNNRPSLYKEALGDDESLSIFLRNMAKFDAYFCEAMTAGIDFTLRFEIRGNQGKMLHCRVHNEGFERPAGVEKVVEEKRRGRVKTT